MKLIDYVGKRVKHRSYKNKIFIINGPGRNNGEVRLVIGPDNKTKLFADLRDLEFVA